MPVRAQVGGSEISVAVSTSGQNVVVATNSGYSTSSNGGVTFAPRRTVPPGTLASYNGDPSLALGQSGNFYYALIGFPSNTQNATSIWVSTDNGQNFAYRANAVLCPNLSTPPNPGECFADQEHIAADRWNAAVGGDQVYSTWRNFDDTDEDPALVCSQDNATTWTAPITVGAGVKPRLTVGQDGFVYVVWLQGEQRHGAQVQLVRDRARGAGRVSEDDREHQRGDLPGSRPRPLHRPQHARELHPRRRRHEREPRLRGLRHQYQQQRQRGRAESSTPRTAARPGLARCR